PYSAIKQAGCDLVRQLLSQPAENLHKFQKTLKKSLGNNARVIIDLIPELEIIIGKYPPVTQLNPVESRNRIMLTFKNFLTSFAGQSSPLVFFLDDLQWCDNASLELIRTIFLEKEIKYCLFLGTYRENE